jgi:hypothetical protein
MKLFLTVCCVLAGGLLFPARAPAQALVIDWHQLSGGGGSSAGGNFSVSGTIGQPDAGSTMSGGNFSLTGGYWSIIAVFQAAGAPGLVISHQGQTVTVAWPNTGSFVLQQNGGLNPSGWAESGYTVTLADGTNSITFTPPNGNLYFRLKQ